ncbi:MAG TPA: hypothetical protein VIT92_07315, partial [Burkholderiaceae bacterium]
MIRILVAAALLAAGSHGAAHAQSAAWQQIAKTDLDFVYQTLKDNHPGAIDKDNPYFRRWMDTGYAQAAARAAKAASLSDVVQLLGAYGAGFADGHLSLHIQYQDRNIEWPGLLVARQGAKYVIRQRPEALAAKMPLGAEIVSCDGLALDAILDRDVLPYKFNNLASEATRIHHSSALFTLDSTVTRPRLKNCTASVDGKPVAFDLEWRRISQADFGRQLTQAYAAPERRFGMTEVAPKIWWITLPTFNPSPTQEAELKKITADLAGLRNANLIVFDVRGNGGGNSRWGYDLLAALYGPDYVRARFDDDKDDSYAEWRVSKINHAYLADVLVPKVTRQFGADNPSVRNFADLEKRMGQALHSG